PRRKSSSPDSFVVSVDAIALARDEGVALGERKIVLDHLLDHALEAGLGAPAELLPRLRRVPEQAVDLRGPKVARVYADDRLAGSLVDALLVEPLAAPFELEAEEVRGERDQLADRALLAGRDHVVVGLGLLQHQPLREHVVARVSPIAARVEI